MMSMTRLYQSMEYFKAKYNSQSSREAIRFVPENPERLRRYPASVFDICLAESDEVAEQCIAAYVPEIGVST
jgi:hypothetical protein